MKCPDCKGRKFFEKEHGLVMVRCETCKGSGEIDNDGDRGDFDAVGVPAAGKSKKRSKRKKSKGS